MSGEGGTLIVDAKEPASIRAVADGVENMAIDAVIIGEYRKYAIERKTVTDLYDSIIDGRLIRQLKELERLREEEGYIPILAVVGDWGRLSKMLKLTLYQIFGLQMTSIAFGVGMVWIKKKEHYIEFLNYLKKKSGRKPRYSRPTIPKPMERTMRDEVLDVITAMRGIGEKNGIALMERFRTIKNLACASLEELSEVIGGKRAEHVYNVLNWEWDSHEDK